MLKSSVLVWLRRVAMDAVLDFEDDDVGDTPLSIARAFFVFDSRAVTCVGFVDLAPLEICRRSHMTGK